MGRRLVFWLSERRRALADTATHTQPQSVSYDPAAGRVRGFGATVFAEFTALANQTGAVNLGQGFPNFAAPDFVKAAAQAAIAADLNQYARSAGQPRLVQALAATYSPLFGRTIDPLAEIVVTVGATEGIFATMQALVEPGDEVILIEPFYDSYPAAVTMAGGRCVYVPLRAPANAAAAADWVLDTDELAAAFSPRTKLLVLNTPLNPLGKVFTRDELQQIAALAIEHNITVLSDEVYEWMVYATAARPVAHVRIATLPGMWERTVTLGSAGKTFSVTGWKIGWAIAPAAAGACHPDGAPVDSICRGDAAAGGGGDGVRTGRAARVLCLAGSHVPGQARQAAAGAGGGRAAADGAGRFVLYRGRHQFAVRAGRGRRTPRCRSLPLADTRSWCRRHSTQPILQRAAPSPDR